MTFLVWFVKHWLRHISLSVDRIMHGPWTAWPGHQHLKAEKQIHWFFFSCGILVPWPGIEPAPPALDTQSLNHWKRNCSHLLMSDSLRPHALWPTRLLCPWNFPGQNTGLLPFPSPGDLPNPGSNPSLSNCRQILYHLSHQGSLKPLNYQGNPQIRWLMPQILSTWCVLDPVPAGDYGPYSQGTPGLGPSLIFSLRRALDSI